MSERMTAEELAEIEKRHAHAQHYIDRNEHTGASRMWQEMHADRAVLLAHLRASQTPPQAVTREQIAALLAGFRGWCFERLDTWSDDKDSAGQKKYLKEADAILALLAEKPQTPPHAVTPEMVAVAWPTNADGFSKRIVDNADGLALVKNVLALLAEKPAHTPTPLADHLADPAHYAEAAKHGLSDVAEKPATVSLTLTDEERGLVEANRNWVPGLIAIIERLSASPTAPKGDPCP